MANHVNIKEIARVIDEKPFDMNWFSYDLGRGWGARLSKYKSRGAVQGIFTPGINNKVTILQVYKKLKNNDFTDIAGFYVAILAFFGEKFYKKLNFVEKIPKNSINTLVSTQKCPERFKDEIYEICHTDFDFLDFVSAASALEKTFFDEKSVISVYKLQGNGAIYPLLCQMFYNNRGIDIISPSLVDDIPIQFSVEISDYVSGCHFPVAVSPKTNEFKWQKTQNGWFLYTKYDENWVVLDVASVGRVNLSNYALGNRLNYVAGGGLTIPYQICWNWGEIIDAYHYFGSSLLVRDLKNDLFYNYWFNFGPKSLINVRFRGNYINLDKNYRILPVFNPDFISEDKHGIAYLTADLSGEFVDYCSKDAVFYSDSEVFDWFELGKMLK